MIDFSRIIQCQIPQGNVAQIDINGKKTWISGKRYGFKRDKSNSDPSSRITYIYDAENMIPMSVNLSTNIADYGSWKEFIDEICRPVFLNYDGVVDHELDHNDQTKRLDGTASYAGDKTKPGNAMVEFRKYKWVKRYEDERYQYVIFSDAQCDPEYKAHAFTNEAGECQDAFYWAMFEYMVYNNVMRSIGSSSTVTINQSISNHITYATNMGPGWNIAYKSGWEYITDLLTLLGKTDDCQAVFGVGKTSGSTSDVIKSGSLRTKGAFWGSTSTTSGVKALYIENPWGNCWEHMQGIMVKGTNGLKIKMTPPYNVDGNGYNDAGLSLSGSVSGYLKSIKPSTNLGWLPLEANGTNTTYLCDSYGYNTSKNPGVARIGGRYDAGKGAGIHALSLATSLTATGDTAARLTYLKPPENKQWSVAWEAQYGLPNEYGWAHTTSPGSIVYGEDHGPAVKLTCTNGTSNQTGCALRLSDYAMRYAQRCALEAEIFIEQVESNTGGVRLILGGGSAAGAVANKGIKVTINHNTTDDKTYVNVLSTTNTIGTQTKTKEISLNEWHTILLELNLVTGINTVSLDGEIISTQTNSQLSTMDTNNTWFNVKNGTCWCRALRYRRLL